MEKIILFGKLYYSDNCRRRNKRTILKQLLLKVAFSLSYRCIKLLKQFLIEYSKTKRKYKSLWQVAVVDDKGGKTFKLKWKLGKARALIGQFSVYYLPMGVSWCLARADVKRHGVLLRRLRMKAIQKCADFHFVFVRNCASQCTSLFKIQ